MSQQNPMTRSEQTQVSERGRGERQPFARPPVDIYENEDEVLLVADMPGVTRDALSIEIDRAELRIEGTRERHLGRSTRDFRRRFTLPEGIDADRVVAQLENGVLNLHLPKSAKVKPRRIEVKG